MCLTMVRKMHRICIASKIGNEPFDTVCSTLQRDTEEGRRRDDKCDGF